MRFLRYTGKRLLFLLPQLVVVSFVVFFLIRLLPGDPAYLLAGQFATPERIAEVRHDLRLDLPLIEQYGIYLLNVLHGDFGTSWRTSQSVLTDVAQRLPATLELVILSGLASVLIGIPVGIWTAVRRRGVLDRVLFGYGMLAGSVPDFWLGLILIFVFFSLLGWVPGPIGQLDPVDDAPTPITGMVALDALLAGQWDTLRSALAHLVLPVATLTLVYMALIIKNVRATMQEMMRSDFVLYARALGLGPLVQLRYALRNSMTSMVTVIGIMVWFMLGGAVLVETVFAWDGLGQYAVESVVNSDYAPLQAFVLIAAVFTMLVFLLVDLAYFLIDPRIKG